MIEKADIDSLNNWMYNIRAKVAQKAKITDANIDLVMSEIDQQQIEANDPYDSEPRTQREESTEEFGGLKDKIFTNNLNNPKLNNTSDSLKQDFSEFDYDLDDSLNKRNKTIKNNKQKSTKDKIHTVGRKTEKLVSKRINSMELSNLNSAYVRVSINKIMVALDEMLGLITSSAILFEIMKRKKDLGKMKTVSKTVEGVIKTFNKEKTYSDYVELLLLVSEGKNPIANVSLNYKDMSDLLPVISDIFTDEKLVFVVNKLKSINWVKIPLSLRSPMMYALSVSISDIMYIQEMIFNAPWLTKIILSVSVYIISMIELISQGNKE